MSGRIPGLWKYRNGNVPALTAKETGDSRPVIAVHRDGVAPTYPQGIVSDYGDWLLLLRQAPVNQPLGQVFRYNRRANLT